jgi:hypothetical protein
MRNFFLFALSVMVLVGSSVVSAARASDASPSGVVGVCVSVSDKVAGAAMTHDSVVSMAVVSGERVASKSGSAVCENVVVAVGTGAANTSEAVPAPGTGAAAVQVATVSCSVATLVARTNLAQVRVPTDSSAELVA